MYWGSDFRVIWYFSQAVLYNTQRHTLFLCDSSQSPPGYTLLWVPTDSAYPFSLSFFVKVKGVPCISSAKLSDYICTNLHPTLPITMHGPCSSVITGTKEYDLVFCIVSDFWPPAASSWSNRCHSWPPPDVVNDIVRSGCHFLPIGNKYGDHGDNEWRVSFSQAEQKLLYTMNHTQFLTYGLLKLFVKDINSGLSENENLLCSYNIKTAIFWAIQQNTIAYWCPENLLAGFWVCFKLLLKWVYEGVCPNFFIPENNLFRNKVHGKAQYDLFSKLYSLYEKGVAFPLQCPAINSYIMDFFCNPKSSVCTNECSLISEVVLDKEIIEEIYLDDEILMTEKKEAALYSFHQSLKEEQFNMIQMATRYRIQNLLKRGIS